MILASVGTLCRNFFFATATLTLDKAALAEAPLHPTSDRPPTKPATAATTKSIDWSGCETSRTPHWPQIPCFLRCPFWNGPGNLQLHFFHPPSHHEIQTTSPALPFSDLVHTARLLQWEPAPAGFPPSPVFREVRGSREHLLVSEHHGEPWDTPLWLDGNDHRPAQRFIICKSLDFSAVARCMSLASSQCPRRQGSITLSSRGPSQTSLWRSWG